MSQYQSIDFTENAWNLIRATAGDQNFKDMDENLIYDTLLGSMRYIPFGDYLKRFLFKEAEIPGAWEETDDELYTQLLVDAFTENATPASFTGTTASLRLMVSKWLKQKNVKRETVLLLGFGLRLTVEEVNTFLTKALRLNSLNYHDPLELACAYCYRKKQAYPRFEIIRKKYERTAGTAITIDDIDPETIHSEEKLLEIMAGLKKREGEPYIYAYARQKYRELYKIACDVAADYYNNYSEMKRVWTAEDIQPVDLEKIISAAIPINQSGNKIPASKSTLGELFEGRNFNRQRISEILTGRILVNRFDLMTLLFFAHSQRENLLELPPRQRLMEFYTDTNNLFAECRFAEMNPSNPYEAFLLMCMLTEAPLSTYSDVWERAYNL